MRLKAKLNLAIIVAVIVVVASIVVTLWLNITNITELRNNDEMVQQAVGNISEVVYPSLKACEDMKMAVVQVQQWCTDISATRALDGYDDGLLQAAEWAVVFDENLAFLNDARPEMKAELDAIAAAFPPYYETGQRMAQAYIDQGPAGGNLLMGEFDEVATQINDLVDALVAVFEQEHTQAVIGIASNQQAIRTRSVYMLGTALAAIILLVVVIIQLFSILRPIINDVVRLGAAAETMSEGDFSTRLAATKRKDEFGVLMNAFSQLGDHMRDLLETLTTAAMGVASSSSELQRNANETSKAVEEVSKTIEQVSQGAQETTSNANQATEILQQTAIAIEGVNKDIEEVAGYANAAAEQGHQGRAAADEAAQIIDRSAASVTETAQTVESLGSKTAQIAEFISIITGIADQTNLLALNAAIEAARAGEAGRGFAVVAEEVRKLAEESNAAAGNITALVKAIEGEMQTALSAMQRSNEDVAEGARAVQQTSLTIKEIVNGVLMINEKVQSLSAAAQQVNASTGEVVNAVSLVSSEAEQSAAATAEASASAEEQNANMQQIVSYATGLAAMAQELEDVSSRFQL